MAKIKIKVGKPVRAGSSSPRNTGGVLNARLMKLIMALNEKDRT